MVSSQKKNDMNSWYLRMCLKRMKRKSGIVAECLALFDSQVAAILLGISFQRRILQIKANYGNNQKEYGLLKEVQGYEIRFCGIKGINFEGINLDCDVDLIKLSASGGNRKMRSMLLKQGGINLLIGTSGRSMGLDKCRGYYQASLVLV
ncbi:hypothetical protein YC2023_076666 [Brassica napus]